MNMLAIGSLMGALETVAEILQPLMEMMLLAAIIYLLFYSLRGTRGSNMLWGIALVLVVFTTVVWLLNFSVVLWLMGRIWLVVPTLLIVVFQPELRRFFAHLGSNPFSQLSRRREGIGEVIQAVEEMSRSKTGALIVFEGKIGMQNLINDSIGLDIKLNALIIESIFYPNSPLHDGAMVIRNDRIVAARAILPLSRDENLSRTMGTRHRAALGITEENDCVVVIVSEETGGISVACSGGIQRDLSVPELSRRLHELLLRETAPSGAAGAEKAGLTQFRTKAYDLTKRLLTHDLPRKLLALVLAFGVYLIGSLVVGKEQVVTKVPLEIEVPDTLVNMDRSRVYLDRVVLRGAPVDHSKLTAKVQIDRKRFHRGEPYTATITPDDITGPFGSKVISVEPQTIILNLEAAEAKQLPVVADLSKLDLMNKNYTVGEVTFNPKEVTVSGPESLLKDLSAVRTEPVPLKGGLTEGFTYEANLAKYTGLTLRPAVVECKVEVRLENSSREFDAIPIRILTSREFLDKNKVELFSNTNVKITLYGSSDVLAHFSDKSLCAYADLSSPPENQLTFTADVKCLVPPESKLQVKDISPRQVTVKIVPRNATP